MTPPQGMSADKVKVAYAAILANSYEEERDVELGVFDTNELAQKRLDEYAAEYKVKYPGEQTIWYLTPQVVERRTIAAEDFISALAAARAEERSACRYRAIEVLGYMGVTERSGTVTGETEWAIMYPDKWNAARVNRIEYSGGKP